MKRWNISHSYRLCLLLYLGLLAYPSLAAAKSLISDISDHIINIDTKFTGTDILLFGARNEPGDIVVVLRGPRQSYAVRKKERIAKIWVNREQVRFDDVDSFYAIASSRPLQALKSDSLLASLRIGIHNLPFVVVGNKRNIPVGPFRDALFDKQLHSNLYASAKRSIPFMGEILFRTVIRFPENIPRGTYTAETYLINNGQLISVQSTPIIVRKIGFDAYISDLAHDNAVVYGLLSIGMALVAGWLAGLLFRKM